MRKLVEVLVQAAFIAAFGYVAWEACRPVWPIVYTERIGIGATG